MADRTPQARAAGAGAGDRRPGARPGGAARATGPGGGRTRDPGGGLVLGDVPSSARLSGALLALAGLVGAVAVFPARLVVDGQRLSLATGPLDVLVALGAPLVLLAVGAGLAAGRVPRFGLAFAAVTGSLAGGRVLVELYQGLASTTRAGTEVLAGDLVVTTSVEPAAGWTLGVVALALAVLAGLVALVAWGRTVMADAGSLDSLRPVLTGSATLLGVGAVLCLALPAADVPDELVTDPVTGLVAVLSTEGPRPLLEQPGPALLGGLLLAAALLLSAVVAPTLRPRLGAVGGLLAVAVAVLAAGLTGLRDALHSPDLDWSVPGVGLVVLGVLALGLTALAWRWHPAAGRAGDDDRGQRFLPR